MSFRAKFVVSSITDHGGDYRTIRFDCRYDETIPEDRRFYQWTPTGHVEMTVSNPAVLEQLKPGKAFYADFSPVEENNQ